MSVGCMSSTAAEKVEGTAAVEWMLTLFPFLLAFLLG